MTKKEKEQLVPIWERRNLTVDEASVYSFLTDRKIQIFLLINSYYTPKI